MQGRQVRKVGWGPRKTRGLPLSVLVDRPKQGLAQRPGCPEWAGVLNPGVPVSLPAWAAVPTCSSFRITVWGQVSSHGVS